MDVPSALALPIFAELDAADAAAFVQHARVVELPAGEILFRRGQPDSSVYFVLSGRVEIVLGDESPSGHRLATLEAGAILGEIAMLIDTPRMATVVALTDARLAEIERGSFYAALEDHDRWAEVLLRTIACVLAERLSTVDRRLLSLIEADRGNEAEPTTGRVAELEQLRRRLLSDWRF